MSCGAGSQSDSAAGREKRAAASAGVGSTLAATTSIFTPQRAPSPTVRPHLLGAVGGDDPHVAGPQRGQMLDPVADDALAENRGRGERAALGQVRHRQADGRADEQRFHQ